MALVVSAGFQGCGVTPMISAVRKPRHGDEALVAILNPPLSVHDDDAKGTLLNGQCQQFHTAACESLQLGVQCCSRFSGHCLFVWGLLGRCVPGRGILVPVFLRMSCKVTPSCRVLCCTRKPARFMHGYHRQTHCSPITGRRLGAGHSGRDCVQRQGHHRQAGLSPWRGCGHADHAAHAVCVALLSGHELVGQPPHAAAQAPCH